MREDAFVSQYPLGAGRRDALGVIKAFSVTRPMLVGELRTCKAPQSSANENSYHENMGVMEACVIICLSN